MHRTHLAGLFAAATLAAVGACGGPSGFVECRDDTSCGLQAGGQCMVNPSSGNQFCAYPDGMCESGFRWSDFEVEPDIAGECVGATTPDGGIDAEPEPDGPPPDAGANEANFARRYGDFSSDELAALAVDSDGDYAIGGYFRDDVDFGGGTITADPNGDMVVASYTNNGAFAWSTSFGDASIDRVRAIAFTPDGGVAFCGQWSGTIDFGDGPVTSVNAAGGDIAIGKLAASNGDPVWVRTLRSSLAKQCDGIAVDASGDVYVVGTFGDAVDFGAGNVTPSSPGSQGYVARYDDDNGALVWVQQIGGTSPDNAKDVAIAANGDVIVAGRFRGTVNFGGGDRTSVGNADVFVFRMTSAAAYVWDTTFGSIGFDDANGLVIDDGGDIYAAGSFSGTIENGATDLETAGDYDGFLTRLTGASGARQWIIGLGGASLDQVNAVTIDTAGRPTVIGHFMTSADFGNGTVTSAGGEDIFVATYAASNGAFVDARRFGGTIDDRGLAIAPGRDMNLYIGGQFRNSVDFGVSVLSTPQPSSEPDMFIVRYKP